MPGPTATVPPEGAASILAWSGCFSPAVGDWAYASPPAPHQSGPPPPPRAAAADATATAASAAGNRLRAMRDANGPATKQGVFMPSDWGILPPARSCRIGVLPIKRGSVGRTPRPRQAAPAPRRDARPPQPDGPNSGGTARRDGPAPRPERRRAAALCGPALAPVRPGLPRDGTRSAPIRPSGADAPPRAAPASLPSGSGRLRARAVVLISPRSPTAVRNSCQGVGGAGRAVLTAAARGVPGSWSDA